MKQPNRRASALISSPKRKDDIHASNGATAYDYYAAFSHTFVSDLLDDLRPSNDHLLLDPWNGRGTTTSIAAHRGLKAVGLDLNPAMVAIANARLVNKELAAKAQRRIAKLNSQDLVARTKVSANDGLLTWLTPRSVATFRALQGHFEAIATEITLKLPDHRFRSVQNRRLRLFLNLSLCSALRNILNCFETSNPTWIAQYPSASTRLRPSADVIEAFAKAYLINAVEALPSETFARLQTVTVAEADSRALPLPTGSIALVIASPPYCTRIDYAVATSPELYLLCSLSQTSFRDLRDRLLGTTSITLRRKFPPPAEWGRRCVNTLRKIAAHPSKASDTYYLKNLLQYFSGLSESLREINRVTAPKASIALVVQDSYYKEIHVDLAGVITGMAAPLGWRLRDRRDYAVPTTMAASNPNSRSYRDTFTATESLLVFKKTARVS